MKKLFSLILAFCLLSPVIADDDFYDTAHKLATCSGAFETSSQLFSSLGGSDAETTVVQEKANGWLVASVVFFMTDGMTAEGSWSSAQGVKDTTISYWMARIESSLDQYDMVVSLTPWALLHEPSAVIPSVIKNTTEATSQPFAFSCTTVVSASLPPKLLNNCEDVSKAPEQVANLWAVS
jgi:hypothetical protein